METLKRKNFSKTVVHNSLVNCGRHCCLCGKFAGMKMELHHIDGVDDNSADNCIPLCYDCHSEVKSFNPKHPKGKPYTPKELKAHRDKCYERYGNIQRTISVKQSSTTQNDIWDRLEQPITGSLSWGYMTLDRITPLYQSSIVLIAGYPSTGKSIFVQNIARRNLRDKKSVSYISLKESRNEIEDSIITGEAGVNIDTFNQRNLTENDWKRIVLSLGVLNVENLNFVALDDEENLQEQIFYFLQTQKTDLLIIDDFDGLLLKNDGEKREFMYRLKDILNDIKTTIIIIANVEYPEKKRISSYPELSDFKSDILPRLSDIIAFTHSLKDDYYSNDYLDNGKTLEIIIAKSRRTNRLGMISLKFVNNTTNLVEIVGEEKLPK